MVCEKWLLWNHAYSLWLEHRFLFQWYSAVIHSKRSEGFLLIKLSKVWIIHFICWGLISFLSYKHEYEICFKNTGIKLWKYTQITGIRRYWFFKIFMDIHALYLSWLDINFVWQVEYILHSLALWLKNFEGWTIQ